LHVFCQVSNLFGCCIHENGKLLDKISSYELSPGKKLSVKLVTLCTILRSIKSNAVWYGAFYTYSAFTLYSSPETNSMVIKVSQPTICVNFKDKFSVLNSCSAMALLPDEGDTGKSLKHHISVPN
jgi:hypothetical protein